MCTPFFFPFPPTTWTAAAAAFVAVSFFFPPLSRLAFFLSTLFPSRLLHHEGRWGESRKRLWDACTRRPARRRVGFLSFFFFFFIFPTAGRTRRRPHGRLPKGEKKGGAARVYLGAARRPKRPAFLFRAVQGKTQGKSRPHERKKKRRDAFAEPKKKGEKGESDDDRGKKKGAHDGRKRKGHESAVKTPTNQIADGAGRVNVHAGEKPWDARQTRAFSARRACLLRLCFFFAQCGDPWVRRSIPPCLCAREKKTARRPPGPLSRH